MPQKTLPPIKAVCKEVHAFYNVVLSLNSVLKDEDVQTITSANITLIETVEDLTKPINNYEVILRQLIVKLERLRVATLQSDKMV